MSAPSSPPLPLSPPRSDALGAAWAWRASALLAAALQVWALLRFYRRFEFATQGGRVWGLSDDVYISACFGRSLVGGHGLLWYPGAPRVEGISNPLWSAVIGLLHLLPGFREERLGLFVVATNALLLVVSCALFVAALRRWAGDAGDVRAAALAVPLLACNVALAYWSAEGFEVALIAALALSMWHCALRPPSAAADLGLVLGFVCGVATRMDFALVAAAPLALCFIHDRRDARQRWRRVARLGVLAAAALCALLAARKLYYGDLLPNTYYLKATGWPAAPRVARGLRQNANLVLIAFLIWLPLFARRAPALLGARFAAVIACFAAFSLTVAYSVYVGGDSWGLYGGYDRHTVVGGVFLTLGLCLAATARDAPRALRGALAGAALLAAAWPVSRGAWPRTAAGLFAEPSPLRAHEAEWIRYARSFERISRPGARLAVCPAGALVYFSHRGGVDLLGKVEPYVARLPVSFRTPKGSYCWKGIPGHNKEDDPRVFALHAPEFSRYLPPRNVRARYVRVRYQHEEFYVLRGSALARWDVIPRRAIAELE
jgi:hypothetical protein